METPDLRTGPEIILAFLLLYSLNQLLSF